MSLSSCPVLPIGHNRKPCGQFCHHSAHQVWVLCQQVLYEVLVNILEVGPRSTLRQQATTSSKAAGPSERQAGQMEGYHAHRTWLSPSCRHRVSMNTCCTLELLHQNITLPSSCTDRHVLRHSDRPGKQPYLTAVETVCRGIQALDHEVRPHLQATTQDPQRMKKPRGSAERKTCCINCTSFVDSCRIYIIKEQTDDAKVQQFCDCRGCRRTCCHTVPNCPPALYRPPAAAAPTASWLALVMTPCSAAAHLHASKHQDHACSTDQPQAANKIIHPSVPSTTTHHTCVPGHQHCEGGAFPTSLCTPAVRVSTRPG